MTPLTIDEQIAQVDNLVEALRNHRGSGSEWEPAYWAMKQVAKDLRAQRQDTITAAEHALAARVLRCRQTQGRSEEYRGAMMNLANEAVARWPTIRVAFRIAGRLAEIGPERLAAALAVKPAADAAGQTAAEYVEERTDG